MQIGRHPDEEHGLVTPGNTFVAPCPFCKAFGFELEFSIVFTDDYIVEGSRVECDKCKACGPIMPDLPAAIKAWNKRD